MGLISSRVLSWFGKSSAKTPARRKRAPASAQPSQFVGSQFPASQFPNSEFPASQYPASQLPQAPGSRHPAISPHAIRKDLLRMVLRDTLNRNGIPVSWMTVEALAATSRGREPGVHARLMVRHWDARLMTHAVALQDNFEKRLLAMDPLAGNWLLGISWQFALEDKHACPPLPHPGSWTADPPAPAAAEHAAGSPPNPTDGALRTVPLYIGGEAVTSQQPPAVPREPS